MQWLRAQTGKYQSWYWSPWSVLFTISSVGHGLTLGYHAGVTQHTHTSLELNLHNRQRNPFKEHNSVMAVTYLEGLWSLLDVITQYIKMRRAANSSWKIEWGHIYIGARLLEIYVLYNMHFLKNPCILHMCVIYLKSHCVVVFSLIHP